MTGQKGLATSKNLKEYPIICFSPDKKINFQVFQNQRYCTVHWYFLCPKERERERAKARARAIARAGNGKGQERDRERDRERDKEREREKDRERDRERDGERERERERAQKRWRFFSKLPGPE